MLQIRYEQKLYWRSPSSAMFTFLFPILLLVIFASLNYGATLRALGGISYNQYYVPGIVAFGVISACYSNLAIGLCFRRDSGVLKRIRGTPLPPWVFMAGNIGSALVVSGILSVLTTAVGVTFYGVSFPGRYGAFVLTLAVGAFCFCSLGLAITALIPVATAAPAIVNGLLFPILFISGTFFPVDSGSWLARIASVFPIRHFEEAVFTVFDPRVQGSGVRVEALLVIALASGSADQRTTISACCMFYNQFLPGGTGGDVVKTYLLWKETPDQKPGALLSVLFDRLVGLIGLIVITSILIFLRYEWLTREPEPRPYVMVVLALSWASLRTWLWGQAADRGARQASREQAVAAIERIDDHDIVGEFQRHLDGVGQPPLDPALHDQPVDQNVNRVVATSIELDVFVERQEPAIDARPGEPARAQGRQFPFELTLAAAHDRRQHVDARILWIEHHHVHDALERLGGNLAPALGTVRDADVGEEEPQVIVDFSDGADGRPRIRRRRLLFDRDGGRQAVDEIDVRFLHLFEELPGVGRQRLHVAALSFGVNRVEGERRLTRP
jgi:ABC-2 type transport system permease protein